jgi:hypothetical protein
MDPKAPKTVNCLATSMPADAVTIHPTAHMTGIATIHTCQSVNLGRSNSPCAIPTAAPEMAPMIASSDVDVS